MVQKIKCKVSGFQRLWQLQDMKIDSYKNSQKFTAYPFSCQRESHKQLRRLEIIVLTYKSVKVYFNRNRSV